MAPREISLNVNGVEVRAPAGEILLHTLRRLGVPVPTLCHDDRLTPYGGCRLCVVARRDGVGGLVPSCSTPVQRGMVIETDPPEVIESRRLQLQLITLNHRMDCPVCERSGDCRLQDLIYEYGIPEDRLPFPRATGPRDERSPVIVRDPEKCIVCGKCVRLCDEVQGVAAIGFVDHGYSTRVTTVLERPLDCEFCGQCVNACPVGALVARPYTTGVPAWRRQATTTTCSFCSCGCQITVETADARIARVRAGAGLSPNHDKLCVKGWLGWDLLDDPERIRSPLVRRDGRLVETRWDEALDEVATGLRRARGSDLPRAGLGSARLTCEDAYLMQRLFRGTLDSPHIAPGIVGGIAALIHGLGAATGVPRSSASFDDLHDADLVLVLRGDPTRTHPLVKTELVQGVCQRGQRLVLAHALSGGLERTADTYLPLEPGSEEALVHGLVARWLERHGGAPKAYRAIDGFEPWAASVHAYTPAAVAAATGASEGEIDELSDALDAARRVVIVVVTGLGIPGDEAAVAGAAASLATLLSSGGRQAGVLVLGEKANVQGVVDVGLHPGLLPGHRSADDDGARRDLGEAWGVMPARGPGWTSREIFSRAARGEIGALILAGEDPVKAWPQGLCAREAIEKPDMVVVLDAFLTETARHADVVLPVRILGDRDGSVVSADGTRRRLRRVPPGGGDLPQDGEIFAELARRLGSNLPQGEELTREMERAAGWPHRGRGVRRLDAVARPRERTPWSGILLDASPQLFHSGSVTLRSRQLQRLSPTVALRLSPADARDLGVASGDAIRVAAAERELMLRARVDRTVRRGTVVVAWQSGRGGGAGALITEIGPPQAVTIRRSR